MIFKKLKEWAKRPFSRTVRAKLVIMRHGQTEDNIRRIDTAQNDEPLNKTGEEQARAAGPLIRDIRFDKVFSSPLSRAVDTGRLALQASGTQPHLQRADGTWQIETRPEIIEQNDGILTGRHMEDPLVVDYFKHSLFESAPPGGESDRQLIERVTKFYDEEVVPRLARGENVLLTAHTGTIRAFDIALGLSPCPAPGKPWKSRRRIPNAGPDVHEYENGVRRTSYALENPVTTQVDNEIKARKLAAEKARKEGPG